MTTKLQVYNAVLRLIGDAPLASLSEEGERKRTLDEVYDPALLYALEQGYWNFAKRTLEASDAASVSPAFGYTYAYTKPNDWLRTMMVSADPAFSVPFRDYQDENGYWYTSINPLYVQYVSSDTAYGLDLGKWPMTFTRFVEAHIAAEIVERNSQNASKHEVLRKMERARLNDARSKDAMNEPTRFPPTGAWVNSRGAARVNRSRWDGTFR